MTAPKSRHSQLEIHAAYSPAGFRVWSVMVRDLLYGLRRLDKFYSRREAIAYAERWSHKMRVHFERGRRRPEVRLAERTKFAAWQKRQQLIVQRAAKRGGLS